MVFSKIIFFMHKIKVLDQWTENSQVSPISYRIGNF